MTRDIYRPPEYGNDAVQRAIGKLKSFHDGDIAVLEVVACGDRAIPALQTLLFDREPSGLFQVRVRAVDALAKFGAHEVLVEFLSTPHDVTDPVERLGEDAVINAAARALAYHSDQRVFDLLLRLAHRPCLTGVIFALGNSLRPEAIPLLVEALSEDASRLTAEAVLKRIGAAARPALIEDCEPTRRCARTCVGITATTAEERAEAVGRDGRFAQNMASRATSHVR